MSSAFDTRGNLATGLNSRSTQFMGFDENQQESETENKQDGNKPKTFFGLELSDGVVYTVVIILTLIFIRQVAVVIQALN